MPNPAIYCANLLISHLQNLELTRQRGESLMSSKQIVRRDIEQIYRGLWLDACGSFEQFIEQLFFGLLVGDLVHPSRNVVPRIKFQSYIVARDVICSGKSYVDWLPYDHTDKIAMAFFRNGLPFKSLLSTERNTIRDICHIRNAVAHKSRYSQGVFEKNIIGSLTLPPRDKFPAPYLRTIFRITPNQTRYESYIIEMADIARKLCQ